jgi:hypothetical protein
MNEELQPTEGQEPEQKTYTKAELKEYADNRMKEPLRRLGELETQLATSAAEREQADADRLAKNQEWKQLAEQNAEKLVSASTAHSEEVAKLTEKITGMEHDAALTAAGISNELARLGLKTKYSTLENPEPMSEWLETLRESQPELFTGPAPAVNTKNKAAGPVTPASSQTDEQRRLAMKSTDPEEAAAATKATLEKLGIGGKKF